jgi:hypothetical protein
MPSHNYKHNLTVRLAIAFFSLSVIVLLLVQIILAQQTIGYVLNVKGNWVLDSSQKLGAGSTLPPGGRVQARSPSGGDFIEIADRRGRVIVNKSCRETDCTRPIVLPREETGLFSRLFEAAMFAIRNDPSKFDVLISRAGGELKEAVVKLAGEQVDLSEVLANKSSGKYLLRLIPKDEDRAQRPAQRPTLGPISVDWNAGKLLVVSIKGITPGLYEVQLLDSEDMEPQEPGTEAWVLFAEPENFDEAFCSFREAIATTGEWGEGIRFDTKRQFLRGVLSSLTRNR